MNDLIKLEYIMEDEEELYIEEMCTSQPKLIILVEKLVAYIKTTCVSMRNYAETIALDVEKNITRIKITASLNKIKKRLLSGETVYLPDLHLVTEKYKGVIAKMDKEISKVCNELSSIKLIGKSKRVDRYLEKKDDFERRLESIMKELEEASDKRIAITAKDTTKADRYVSSIIQETKLYVSEYTKLIRDIEKIALDFETCTLCAEISYDVRQLTRTNLRKIEKIKMAATKALRKSTFIICTLIA